jgi:hypothetical protein
MSDWSHWYPFRSQAAKEISAHMSASEKRRVSQVGALYGIGLGIILNLPGFLVMAGVLPQKWIWAALGFLVPVTWILGYMYMTPWSRRFLCNTEWARAKGYKPEEIALYDIRFGMKHLLALMTVVAVVAAIVWYIRRYFADAGF